jgi:hypothetical protein
MRKIKLHKPLENTMNLDQYKQALKSHDWTFEWSDDHNVWKRGTAQRQALRAAQLAIDPNAKIWNSLCHKDYLILKPTEKKESQMIDDPEEEAWEELSDRLAKTEGRKWVGLTYAEVDDLLVAHSGEYAVVKIVRAAEKLLKEKNT